MNTFNTINDKETHMEVDVDIDVLHQNIANDNNGYFPEDVF